VGWDKPKGKQVGDLTGLPGCAGLDTKHNLAPWVQKYTYRLACTRNGSVRQRASRSIARGETVDDVIAQIEEMARVAFGEVETTSRVLRSAPILQWRTPKRELRRIVREARLPERTLAALMDRAPGEDIPDNPSMFRCGGSRDNQANDPRMRTKTGAAARWSRLG